MDGLFRRNHTAPVKIPPPTTTTENLKQVTRGLTHTGYWTQDDKYPNRQTFNRYKLRPKPPKDWISEEFTEIDLTESDSEGD